MSLLMASYVFPPELNADSDCSADDAAMDREDGSVSMSPMDLFSEIELDFLLKIRLKKFQDSWSGVPSIVKAWQVYEFTAIWIDIVCAPFCSSAGMEYEQPPPFIEVPTSMYLLTFFQFFGVDMPNIFVLGSFRNWSIFDWSVIILSEAVACIDSRITASKDSDFLMALRPFFMVAYVTSMSYRGQFWSILSGAFPLGA